MTRCPECLQRVATKNQHMTDDDIWACKEPGIDVVLGSDKPGVMPNPPDPMLISLELKQLLDADKEVYGRAYVQIIDGKLVHIPAKDVAVIFNEENQAIGLSAAKLMEEFNRHSPVVEGGPIVPTPGATWGPAPGTTTVDQAAQDALVNAGVYHIYASKGLSEAIDALDAILSKHARRVRELEQRVSELEAPIPMIMFCPLCKSRHIDTGEFETKPHHTHACQVCGMVWRPMIVATVGVNFLPGFKNHLIAGAGVETCGNK